MAVRLDLKPGETLHLSTSQDFYLRQGGLDGRDVGSAEIRTELSLNFTQVNGTYDSRGRMEASVTIDAIEMKQTINGKTRGSNPLASLNGRTVLAVFERGGKLVDVKVGKELEQSASVIRQMIGGAYGVVNLLPPDPIAVGESVTIPTSVPLRVPGRTDSASYRTRSVTTFQALDRVASERIARFQQKIESADDSERLKVMGTGAFDVNLDRGLVATGSTEWRFSGDVNPSSSSGPGVPIQGTMKITVAARR